MSIEEAAEAGARVRWLVAGTFTRSPAGKRTRLTPDAFAQAMADAGIGGRVTVPDRLGAGDARAYEIAFAKPRAFQATEIVGAVPELKALKQVGEDIVAGRLGPDAAVAKVRELAGDGKLARAVEAILTPAAAAPAKPAATGGGASTGAEGQGAQGDAVESIFSKVGEQTTAPAAASAVSAFVKAIRPDAGAKSAPPDAAKKARAAIEEAVYGTASDITREPTVARLEAAWRGLKLLVDHCPSASGMQLEVLDVAPEGALEAIRAALPEDPIDHPDAIFVVDPVEDPAQATAYAAFGEELNAPVVIAVTPSLFGVTDPAKVSSRIDDAGFALPEAWTALRNDESSRWLCAAFNRVVLAAEGTGALRRTVFGSPVFGVAALVASSFKDSGSFARIFGKNGAVKAGGTWDITSGPEAGNAAPTEAFLSVRAQTRLRELGVLGLGSGRNTDMVSLTAAPTVRAGDDVVPLPAQILTGRIVRFAQWVRDQIPQGAEPKDIATLFEQAAEVFLFPGMKEAAQLKAQVGEDKEGGRAVIVSASVRADHAGIPFHLAFSLPIKR